jgi:hypothetical protein
MIRIKNSMRKLAILGAMVLSVTLSVAFLAQAGQFAYYWFQDKFTDMHLILYSVACFLLSLMVSLILLKAEKQMKWFLPKAAFPQKIHRQQVEKWKPVAHDIIGKSEDLSYGCILSAPTIYSGFFLSFVCQFLILYFAENHYLDFISSIPTSGLQILTFLILLFALLLMIAFLPMALVILLTLLLMRRYLDYPRDEDVIFAECILIAESFSRNDRLSAKNRVGRFLRTLTQFSRNWLNKRRKIYSPEFTILRKSNIAICRMLMFGQEYVAELFTNFGLALATGDDPKAFGYLCRLVSNAREFGEPIGRIEKILNKIERYPKAINLLIYTVVFVVALLTFFLGYPNLASLIRS